MRKRLCCLFLLFAMCCSFCGEVHAAAARMSSQFSVIVSPNTVKTSDISFTLEAGETVEIAALYSPTEADVDFGLIASGGRFYHFSATNGSARKTIEISLRGTYTFAIRNNSDSEITVNGFVSY